MTSWAITMAFEKIEADSRAENESASSAFQNEWMSEQSNQRQERPRDAETPSVQNRDSIPGAGTGDLQDVRKTLVHLAEYNCKFEERQEFAETIGKYLKAFSTDSTQDPSMREAQAMVAKLLENPDQASFGQFNLEFTKMRLARSAPTQATLKELDAERAKEMQKPERKEAEGDYAKKLNTFYASLDKLPKDEKERIMCLLDWQDNVSADVRNARVREGLQSNPEVLAKFEAMREASDKVDAMKSPREKQLTEESRQQVRDNVLLRVIAKLAQQRSRITMTA